MAVGALFLGIPLVVYLWAALSIPKDSLTGPDDFFIALRKVGPTPFANNGIAYAWQVSTVYPFLFWAVSRQVFVPFLNSVCWGVGIFLFALCVPRLKAFMGSDLTLHGFLGNAYSPSVRTLTAIMTIIGLVGVALGEITWGSKVLLPILPDRSSTHFAVFVFVFLVLCYISYGGQISSSRTDQLQLVFSYVGVLGLMIYLFLRFSRSVPKSDYALDAFLLLVAIYPVLLLWRRRGRFLACQDQINRFNAFLTTASNVVLNALLILLCVGTVYLLIVKRVNLQFSGVINLRGFGKAGLLSLVFMPLCWQFVDMTNWQRILAVQPKGSGSTLGFSNVTEGLYLYALESPFTWIIFLVIGAGAMLADPNVVNGDPLVAIPRGLIGSGGLEALLGYIFIMGIIAVMLSTVDSVMVAAMFAFVYDAYPKTRRLFEQGTDGDARQRLVAMVRTARLFGVFILVFSTVAYVILDATGYSGGNFIGALLAIYTALLSMVPSVMGAMFLRKRPPSGWVFASILAGATVGIVIGLYATFLNPDYTWYPVIWTLVLSTGVYCLGYLIGGASDVGAG